MPEPWQLYFDDFRERAEPIARQRFGRSDAFSEAAHDAYQRTADHLTRQQGWEDERTLKLMRGLNGATRRWIDKDEGSWEDLRDMLAGVWREMAGEG